MVACRLARRGAMQGRARIRRIRRHYFGKSTLIGVLESYPKEIEMMETPKGSKIRLRTQLSVRQIRASERDRL